MATTLVDVPPIMKAMLAASNKCHPKISDDIAARARRGVIATLINEAEDGDIEAAKTLLNRAAAWLTFGTELTPELQAYLARAFYRMSSLSHDPGQALHLKRGRGRIKKKYSDPDIDWEILEKVMEYRQKQVSLEEACWQVSQQVGLSTERVRDIWYEMDGPAGLPLIVDIDP